MFVVVVPHKSANAKFGCCISNTHQCWHWCELIGEVIGHGQYIKPSCFRALGNIDPRLAIWLR